MASNSHEVIDESIAPHISEEPSAEGPIDTKTTTQPVIKSMPKSETKDEPRFRTVGSRYRQSTQQWVNKRADDVIPRQEPIGGRTASRSRNPTPNVKTKAKQASTPLSTDKSLNVSGISAINQVVVNKDLNPNLNLNKYQKGLITRRKSMVSKRLPFGPDCDPIAAPVTSRAVPMTLGLENESKAKDMENSILVSIYLETLLLKLKAKQMESERNSNAFNTITQIWSQTNDMKTQLMDTKKCLLSLQNTIDLTDIVEKRKACLDQYLQIRSQMDSLFKSLSQLIVGQKLLLKVENCTQNDFKKLNELMDNSVNSERFDVFDKMSSASVNIENSMNICNEIKSLEIEFNDCHQTFIKFFKDLENYERIGNKMPTLSKLF